MGRRFSKKKNKEAKSEKPKRERSDFGPDGYVEVKRENKDFEAYYKLQKIVPEEEWSNFMKSLQTSLPAAFRITGTSGQANALLKILKEDFFKPLENLRIEDFITQNSHSENAVIDDPIVPLEPKCLSWYPKGLAYQLNLSRRSIRRCEAYWRLHQWLIAETDAGSISRQEAVSMIPPLLLDVQPHHKVLDMCAAPGSKTAQLIEQLHSSSDPLCGALPTGVVVANDADNKRCYLLTHQAKRLQSPCIMITNHDAAFMPNMLYTKHDGSTGKLKFDRILCDVPCSGDGTLRKNCDVWSKWNPVNGCNLHGLQLRIARRGLELLTVGGRMVYSTCSMSPMEDEAVLQRLLIEAGGTVSLVDCSHALPGLKYRPGVKTWQVVTKDMEVISSPADIPTKLTNIYHKHLFPVTQDLHLQRCLRLLPHHQDTGGFFVAVLEKHAPLPGERLEASEAPQAGATQRVKPPPKKRRRRGFKEEPYYYLSESVAAWEAQFRRGVVDQPATDVSEDGTCLAAVVSEEGATASKEDTTVFEEDAVQSKEAGSSSEAMPSIDMEINETITSDCKAIESEDLRVWSSICSFFGLRKDVAESSYRNFMTRSREGKKRNLYFTNSLIRDLIDHNQDRMKIINTGVKAFVRTDNKGTVCDFRLAQEGIQSVSPLITKRRLPVTRADLVCLLNDDDNETPPELLFLSDTCRSAAKNLVTGSVLLVYDGDSTTEGQNINGSAHRIKIELVGWKGKSTLRCYVARNDRVHYLRLLRADTTKYEKNKFVAARAIDPVENDAAKEVAGCNAVAEYGAAITEALQESVHPMYKSMEAVEVALVPGSPR